MSNHTEGLWIVKEIGGARHYITTEDHLLLATVIHKNQIGVPLKNGNTSFEQGKANAKLMAQSPKMYQFCKEITSALKDRGKLSIWETCIKTIADDIIKEVEG